MGSSDNSRDSECGEDGALLEAQSSGFGDALDLIELGVDSSLLGIAGLIPLGLGGTGGGGFLEYNRFSGFGGELMK